eukprot:7725265-Pyramimonas_sp.AAC.1
MAEHGSGAIYPNGTVGGALASASGQNSGAEGHPTHASSHRPTVAAPPDLPADDGVQTPGYEDDAGRLPALRSVSAVVHAVLAASGTQR